MCTRNPRKPHPPLCAVYPRTKKGFEVGLAAFKGPMALKVEGGGDGGGAHMEEPDAEGAREGGEGVGAAAGEGVGMEGPKGEAGGEGAGSGEAGEQHEEGQGGGGAAGMGQGAGAPAEEQQQQGQQHEHQKQAPSPHMPRVLLLLISQGGAGVLRCLAQPCCQDTGCTRAEQVHVCARPRAANRAAGPNCAHGSQYDCLTLLLRRRVGEAELRERTQTLSAGLLCCRPEPYGGAAHAGSAERLRPNTRCLPALLQA